MSTLYVKLLLQFYADLKKIRCFGHGLKMSRVGGLDKIFRLLFVTFLQFELRHFSGIITIKVNT